MYFSKLRLNDLSVVNILALSAVRKLYYVTMDSSVSPAMHVHLNVGGIMTFMRCQMVCIVMTLIPLIVITLYNLLLIALFFTLYHVIKPIILLVRSHERTRPYPSINKYITSVRSVASTSSKTTSSVTVLSPRRMQNVTYKYMVMKRHTSKVIILNVQPLPFQSSHTPPSHRPSKIHTKI